VLINGLLFAAYLFAEFVVDSSKVFAEFVIHSSGVYRWSDCPQLTVYAWVLLLIAQLTKVDVIYLVMEYFPKSLVFGKASPQHLVSCWKWRGNLSSENSTCCPVESGRGTWFISLFIYILIPPKRSEGGGRNSHSICGKMSVTSRVRLSPLYPPTPLVLEGWNLAGIILIGMAQNLWS